MVPLAEPAGSDIRTLAVSAGLVWWTAPDQLPASTAGALAEGRGRGSLVACAGGLAVARALGWVVGPRCGREMNTTAATIASTHTARPRPTARRRNGT